jgi:hypothetical protein
MSKHYDPKTLIAIAAVFTLATIEEQIRAACSLASPFAHSDIRELFHQWRNDTRKALTRRDCQYEGRWGETTQISKEENGTLRTFLDGKRRLISTSSFYQHLITRLILSNPIGAPPLKGEPTSARFGKRTVESGEGSRAG